MSDRLNKSVAGTPATPGPSRPVPMKFFATWEVDRTPSNCIPRLCSLTLSRLVIFRPLGSELTSVSIAVKMQSSKRTLRSNEIVLPANGLLDTGLEMTFCLQYPHFLKRDGNRLHILLQRRKRYKNRTMLGYKTLAEGVIRMDHVLQKQMDMDLELVTEVDTKENKTSNVNNKGHMAIAKLTVLQLSSTPVDQEHSTLSTSIAKAGGQLADSEEEDEFSSGEEAELSDSEPLRSTKRHNLKQRFVSLLRRFRVPDTEASRAALGATLDRCDIQGGDIQALFQELESLSCDEDSAGEQDGDTVSISSTPKPSLRPFFSSSRSLVNSNSANNLESMSVTVATVTAEERDKNSGSDGNTDLCCTDHEAQSDPQTGSPPRDKDTGKSRLFRSSVASNNKKKHSLDDTARRSFLDQLTRLLPADGTTSASVGGCDTIVLVWAWCGGEQQSPHQLLVARLQTAAPHYLILQPSTGAEVRAVLSALLTRIHKCCQTSGKPLSPFKVALVGGDGLVAQCLRHYVELMSSRPADWQAHMRFYVVPLGVCGIARYLASLDTLYASLFPPPQADSTSTTSCGPVGCAGDDLVVKLQRYLGCGNTLPPCIQLSIAEAMLTCQDESSQLFVPFVGEVRVGPADACSSSLSVDADEGPPSLLLASNPAVPCNVSGSTPAQCGAVSAPTPPSSPNVQSRELPWEPLELQLDYWQTPAKGGKCSLKGVFRSLLVSRQQHTSAATFSLHITYTTAKEKKQKIMRLGKKKEKEKENDGRSQTVDGISRLICSVKASHSTPMRVVIDGADWTGVKFFQLSSAWQTHVKHFTVSLVGVPLATSELA